MGQLGRVLWLGEQTQKTNLHLGAGIGGVQLTGLPAAPCNFMPDEGRHGFSHATGGPSGRSEDGGSVVCAPTPPP